ncbi:MAG: hypothetical protein NZ853_00110 [Leptospiraceae bacterium]|nr:hypothetical protein [Leptospiraceae bacterium]MDW7976368.1 hypothetical protein [Leptospiraceae bacterium]
MSNSSIKLEMRIGVFLFLMVFFVFSLFGRSTRNVHGKYTIDDIQKHLVFQIQTERNLYQANELIPVSFQIQNQGFLSFRFYVNQKFTESFYIEILDANGKEIQEQVEVLNHPDFEITSLQKNLVENLNGNPVKEILLHPNEIFTKTFYIKNLPVGEYRIVGYFIPYSYDENYKSQLRFVSKNRITLTITEEQSVFRFVDDQEIPKEAIPSPDEVVYLFLMAEYYKNWDNYFKYIELQDFILSYELFERDYRRADIKTKQNLLNEFKNFLKNQPIDPIIRFQIKEVHYLQPHVAKVFVEVLRGKPGYKVEYLYEYELKRKEYWKIHHVIVAVQKIMK